MRKWMKVSGIVAAVAAVSVMSFAAVSYAQTETPGDAPSLVERFRDGVRGSMQDGMRGHRGGEVDGVKTAALADALGMTVEELQAAQESGQTLEEIAAAQGLDLDTVKESLAAERLATLETTLAEKVAAGEITQEQADEFLSRAQEGDFLGRDGLDGMRGGEFGKRASLEDASPEAQAALAGVLNMSVDELQTAVESGQRLDEIADAQGVEMDAIKAVMNEFRLAEMESTLAEKVAAGDITQEQADAILERAQSGDFMDKGGRDRFDGGQRDSQRDGRRGGMRGGQGEDGLRSFPGDAPDGTTPDDTDFQPAPAAGDSNL